MAINPRLVLEIGVLGGGKERFDSSGGFHGLWCEIDSTSQFMTIDSPSTSTNNWIHLQILGDVFFSSFCCRFKKKKENLFISHFYKFCQIDTHREQAVSFAKINGSFKFSFSFSEISRSK